MDWVVNEYVDQRKSNASRTDVELVSAKREEFYRGNYNYFVRDVSMNSSLLSLLLFLGLNVLGGVECS